MEVQKQLKDMGASAQQAKKISDLMKARGWGLSDLFTHLPEILALIEQIGGLWEKMSKKGSTLPMQAKSKR
jgi:hypothetical protein